MARRLLLLVWAVAVVSALAAEPCPAASGMPRKALILYNSDKKQPFTATWAYSGFQTVLNYYGLVGVSLDVASQALPDDGEMDGVRAVIVSLNSVEIARARDYYAWLVRQMDQGRKLVVLGTLGVETGAHDIEAREDYLGVYERLGVRYVPGPFKDSSRLRFARVDGGLAGFERPYPSVPAEYELYTPLRPDVRTLVSIERTDRPGSESSVVFTSASGGVIAANNLAYWQDPLTFNQRWHLDPFAFLALALDLPPAPVPDPTTLNGLRVAFSHLDGDGFSSVSRIEKDRICGEVLRDEVLAKVDFPVSYSFIQAELAPKGAGDARLVEAARSILALPNVEPASHTYSHPFFWDPDNANQDRYDARFAFDIPGYTFDAWKEIVGSAEYVTQELSPPGKPCRLLFWSGACDPLAEHQRVVQENGLLAINGGDTLWNGAAGSLFGVRPLHRHLGENLHQIHIGQANENILTNLWRGPFNGYRNIIDTMRRTGHPRRLKPIDVYYHNYSAEKLAGLAALKEVYAWVATQPTAPVFTSRYVQSMMDWLRLRVLELGPGRHAVEDYGDCLTLRLPSGSPPPDLDRCENVLGYARTPEGLYVHLAPGAARAVVQAGSAEAGASRVWLDSASGVVRAFRAQAGAVSLEAEFLTRNGRLVLAGFPPGGAVRASGTALKGAHRNLEAGADGHVALDGLATGSLTVSLASGG